MSDLPSIVPVLPRFPRFGKRVCSSELDGSVPIVSRSVALRESGEISALLSSRVAGLPLVVDSVGPVARYHGCRSCPHYGSSFCFEKVVPPKVFAGGVCDGRLNEILDIVELNGSSDALRIRKSEVVERLRKHVVLLEDNLADYRVKRAELLPNISLRPLVGDGGVLLHPNSPEFVSAVAERDLLLAQFDSYQLRLHQQIEFLSVKLAELLQVDARLESNEKIAVSLSPLAVGRLIRESKVIDID